MRPRPRCISRAVAVLVPGHALPSQLRGTCDRLIGQHLNSGVGRRAFRPRMVSCHASLARGPSHTRTYPLSTPPASRPSYPAGRPLRLHALLRRQLQQGDGGVPLLERRLLEGPSAGEEAGEAPGRGRADSCACGAWACGCVRAVTAGYNSKAIVRAARSDYVMRWKPLWSAYPESYSCLEQLTPRPAVRSRTPPPLPQGKPYHISALYLVDLKRFRQIAAGGWEGSRAHARAMLLHASAPAPLAMQV